MLKSRLFHSGILIALGTGLLALAGCVPAATTTPGGEPATGIGFDWPLIVFMVAIFALFYFLSIRPQRKRQKEQQKMMESLKKGDKVITAGGIYGVIESTSEDSVVIRVESGAMLRIAKPSVVVHREG